MRLCDSNHSTFDLSNTKLISSFCLVTDEGVGLHFTEEGVGLHSTEEGAGLQYIDHLTTQLDSNTHYNAVRSA